MNNNQYDNAGNAISLTPAFINKVASMCYGSYYTNSKGEEAFMKHVPAPLLPIYKQANLWHQWGTIGYVPTWHESRNGIIQTNIGVSITDNLSRILGGKISCRTINSALKDKFISLRLDSAINQAINYAVKDGTAMVKTDVNSKGDLVFNAYPLGRFTNTKGIITTFIDSYEDTVRGETYCLFEKRINGAVKYYLTKCQESVDEPKLITYPNIPSAVNEWLIGNGYLISDEFINLPWEGTGCFFLKVRNLAYNPLSVYGESFIQPILADLYEYEYAESGKLVDMYTGRARVIVSQQYANQGNGVSGLDSYMYLTAPDSNIDGGKPTSVQFEYRTDEHIKMKEEILETMASKVGISGISLATFLKSNGVKTATEVNAETDLTASFASAIRRTFIIPFANQLVDLAISYYKLGKVNYELSFPSSGFSSAAIRNGLAINLYQAGLATVAQALRVIYPDADEDTIKGMADEIKKERSEVLI